MSKFNKLLLSVSVASIMSFAAGHAAADTVLTSPTQNISKVAGNAPASFSESTTFSLGSLSEIVGNVSLSKKAGTAAALKSIAADLWYQTGVNTWTSVWSSSASFSQASKTGSWSTSFDQSPLAAGFYKLTLTASIFSNTKFTGYYNTNLSISPVPEPETYAMMGVGLAVVLLRLRKKKVSGSVAVAV